MWTPSLSGSGILAAIAGDLPREAVAGIMPERRLKPPASEPFFL